MFAGKSIVEIREIQKVVSKEGKTAQRLQENGRYSIIKYKKVKARKTMIDIHCHLLYGVDDGAKTIEESVAMLEAAKEQGISAMIRITGTACLLIRRKKLKNISVFWSRMHRNLEFILHWAPNTM